MFTLQLNLNFCRPFTIYIRQTSSPGIIYLAIVLFSKLAVVSVSLRCGRAADETPMSKIKSQKNQKNQYSFQFYLFNSNVFQLTRHHDMVGKIVSDSDFCSIYFVKYVFITFTNSWQTYKEETNVKTDNKNFLDNTIMLFFFYFFCSPNRDHSVQGVRRQVQWGPLWRDYVRRLQRLFSPITKFWRGKLSVSKAKELCGGSCKSEPMPILPTPKVLGTRHV